MLFQKTEKGLWGNDFHFFTAPFYSLIPKIKKHCEWEFTVLCTWWRRCPELNTGIRALRGPRLSAWLHRHFVDCYSISLFLEKVKAVIYESVAGYEAFYEINA